MDKILNVALVGCGNIAQNHLKALKSIPYIKVVALCDIKPERAEKKKAQHAPDAKIYTDYEQMLEEETLDAVHIATPHYLHAPMAIAALNKNINVFLEKPVCISREEIKALLLAEQKSTAKITVCFQNRFNPTTLLAKNIIDEDGGALFGYATVFWDRDEKYYTESGWRGSYKTEGGGVMINQAIHTLDLLIQFLGKPETLYATKANHHLQGIIEVEDTCEGMVKFEGGKVANFYTTTAFLGGNMTTIVFTTKNHTITIQDNSVLYVDGNKIEDPTLETKFVGKQVYGNGHDYTIKAFYSAIVDGTAVPVTLESSTYALRLLLAAYESNDKETKI